MELGYCWLFGVTDCRNNAVVAAGKGGAIQASLYSLFEHGDDSRFASRNNDPGLKDPLAFQAKRARFHRLACRQCRRGILLDHREAVVDDVLGLDVFRRRVVRESLAEISLGELSQGIEVS